MTALALALAALVSAAVPAVPALTGPVVDQAGLLSGAEARRLEQLARAARQAAGAGGGRGVQLQYLIVPSLEGESIEDLSIRVAEQWKLGDKGKDDGVLVLVARDDRRVRIEVGRGLEGELTDAATARIRREVIEPAFRAGRFGDGLYDAGLRILTTTNSLPADQARRLGARASHGSRLGGLGFLGLFILFIVVKAFFGFSSRRRRGFFGGGGPFIGGGFGGFGGGGGGGGSWGGGGGGFSGGGSSGSW
jgi:uncharacterized protein